MIKIIFNRKNKTLNATFTTKSVLKILDANYRTYCSIHNQNMDVEAPHDIKTMVQAVLTETAFGACRGAKMDMDDYLRYYFFTEFWVLIIDFFVGY